MSTREPGDYANNGANNDGINQGDYPSYGESSAQGYGQGGYENVGNHEAAPETNSAFNGSDSSYGTEGYGTAGYGTAGTEGAAAQQPGAAYGGYQSYGDSAANAGYASAPVAPQNNGWAIPALVLGIIALLSSFFGLGGLIGLVGLIVSIVAIVKARKIAGPGRRMGMSVAGLIMSILAVVFFIIAIVVFFSYLGGTGFFDCLELSGTAQEQCFNDIADSQNV